MKVSVVLILLVLVVGHESARTSQVYCGRRLSDVLAVLCWDSEIVKRDVEMVKRSEWRMPMESALALDGVRGKRGPVDECCYKPCTIDELFTYC
ncbi:unnamed protein product [Arctia plantaginis]|uniref:Insulin-like domain-containing protein n=1 Tax=Arctia plantaginis TaxID=874455 RepID=A0A8S0ZBV7_ARCPL|nr:unnamed protein product [Arctia plantaginis]